MYWVSDLVNAQRAVFDACDGRRTGTEIAGDLAANDDENRKILALLAAWVEATALVLVWSARVRASPRGEPRRG